jgi:hypothetical protein
MNFSRWFAPAFAGLVLYGLVELLNAAPPIANAGPDKVDVAIDTPVGLDGTASSDPAGRTLTFAWKFLTRPPGSAATLLNSQSATPTFTPDRNGTYQVLLTAKAGGETATDTVVVITKNHPPVANAGVDSGAPIGKRVRLLGLGTDPDMDKLTYAWTLIAKPDSSRASFASPTKASTVLTLDRPGSYVAELKVTDPFGVSAVDTVEVSHVNSAPIANAGPGQSVPLGSLVTLDASRSSDIDEDPLTYRWALTKPKGSASSISDPDALQPTLTVDLAGTYTAALVADDGNGASNAAQHCRSMRSLSPTPDRISGLRSDRQFTWTAVSRTIPTANPSGTPGHSQRSRRRVRLRSRVPRPSGRHLLRMSMARMPRSWW